MRIAHATCLLLLTALPVSVCAHAPQDLAVRVIPANTTSWTAEIFFLPDGSAGSGGGRIYGREGATRLAMNDHTQRIHDPRTGEVLLFDELSQHGIIESDWRLPWLLAPDVLRGLKVRVTASRQERIAGEEVTCRDLEGADDYGAWLQGTVCTTPDGIHMDVALEGEHPLEGGDEMYPWSAAYTLTVLQRGAQPQDWFERPSHVTRWVAPG